MDQRLSRNTKRTKQRPSKAPGIVAVLESGVSRSGREFWRVRLADGTEKVLRVNPGSRAAIEEAIRRYSGALRRLADR